MQPHVTDERGPLTKDNANIHRNVVEAYLRDGKIATTFRLHNCLVRASNYDVTIFDMSSEITDSSSSRTHYDGMPGIFNRPFGCINYNV